MQETNAVTIMSHEGRDTQGRSEPLRDPEIRSALRLMLRTLHAHEPDTAIIDELSLCQGEARVDMAVVNASFSGYEIKSDRDKLVRLPQQLLVYDLCFDAMTAVVGSKHLASCYTAIPPSWGIWEAIRTADGVRIESRREPTVNRRVAPERVVQLLWRHELIESLRALDLEPSCKAPRRKLWTALVEAVPRDRLLEIVRERIRARGDWRSGPTPFRRGDSFRSAARSRRCLENRQWLLLSRYRHRPD